MTDVSPDVASMINAMSDQLIHYLRAQEMDPRLEGFYTEDATLFPPASTMVTGRAAIGDAIRAMREGGMGNVSMETVKVEASVDLAYRSGRYRPGAPVTEQGTFIEVYRRQPDGSWRCVVDIFNCDESLSSR